MFQVCELFANFLYVPGNCVHFVQVKSYLLLLSSSYNSNIVKFAPNVENVVIFKMDLSKVSFPVVIGLYLNIKSPLKTR